MNLDGTKKSPFVFIDYHGNRHRVTTGVHKLTNEWGTLISTTPEIKTIAKTTTTTKPKTNKQATPPPGNLPTNIHKGFSRTHFFCVMGIPAPGGSDEMTTRPIIN